MTAGKCVGEEREERGTDGAGRGRRKGGGGKPRRSQPPPPPLPTAAQRSARRPPRPPHLAAAPRARLTRCGAGCGSAWRGPSERTGPQSGAEPDRAERRRAGSAARRRAVPAPPSSPRHRGGVTGSGGGVSAGRTRAHVGGESPPPEGSGRAGGNPPRGAAAVNRERLLRFPADISGTDCGVGGRPSRRGAPIPAWGGGGSRRHAARTFGRCRFWCRCRRAAGAAPVLAAPRDASTAPTGLGTRRHLKGPQRFAAGGGSSKGTPPFPLSPAGNAAFPPLPSAALGRSPRARDSVIPRRAGPGRPPGTRRQSPIWQGQAGALCAARWGGGWGRLTCPPAEGSCHCSPAPSRSPT